MPMDRSRYPKDWPEISRAARERAGWVCEYCGAPNGERVYRRRDDPWVWHREDDVDGMNSDMGYALVGDDPITTTIVLTVHHLGHPKPDGSPGDTHDKMDCRPENLVACCQRCHLLLDLSEHHRKARETRRRRFLERTGQQEMRLP